MQWDPQLKATKTLDTLTERRSRRFATVIITNTDPADNIALISYNLDKAQSLLEWVETAVTEGVSTLAPATQTTMYIGL